MRVVRALLILGLLLPSIRLNAQTERTLLSPGIFLRGVQQAQSVRYTASVIKPTDGEVMRNISVEITLPANTPFLEMLVSRQVEYKAIRVSRSRAVTLIWQISRLASTSPLDTFSFTTQQPLTQDLEFYMKWQSEDGTQHIENFTELPPLTDITQREGKFTVAPGGYMPLNGLGIYAVAVDQRAPLDLTVRILPVDFNPPAKFGAIWWCSLLEITGVPAGGAVDVIVPLRRPVAPFASLQLFQRQDDNNWQALDGRALVTADGQYVMYRHPGGVVATGGSPEIQPEAVPADQIPVEAPAEVSNPPAEVVNPPVEQPPQEPPKADGDAAAQNPPDQDNTAGKTGDTKPPEKSDTVKPADNANPLPLPTQVIIIQPTNPPVINTEAPAPTSMPPTSSTIKGGGGVIIVNAGTAIPPTSMPPTNSNITDGTSKTILVGERTATSIPSTSTNSKTDGVIIVNAGTPLPTLGPLPTGTAITDGTSNTILFGERTPTGGLPTMTDGSVRFVTPGTPLATVGPLPTSTGITDGTSNTILVGERTPTGGLPTMTDGSVRFVTPGTPLATVGPLPTGTSLTDGTSNTVLFGERTPTGGLPTMTDGSVRFVTPGTPLATVGPLPTSTGITDGTSNTILVGERTPTGGLPTMTDGSVRIVTPGTLLPTLGPLPTSTGITDGTSNTILVGERTATPLPTLSSIKGGDGVIIVSAASPIPASTNVKGSGSIIIVNAGTPIPPAVTPTLLPTLAANTGSTAIPTATRTPASNVQPSPVPTTIVSGPIITLPGSQNVTLNSDGNTSASKIQPFGSGGPRVEIIIGAKGEVYQCQLGKVNCVLLVRKPGTISAK
jgi:hypothetical protein